MTLDGNICAVTGPTEGNRAAPDFQEEVMAAKKRAKKAGAKRAAKKGGKKKATRKKAAKKGGRKKAAKKGKKKAGRRKAPPAPPAM
jgi:hypothetical protein